MATYFVVAIDRYFPKWISPDTERTKGVNSGG
jgi:hypothetical protein